MAGAWALWMGVLSAWGADARETAEVLDGTSASLQRAVKRPSPQALGALPAWVDLSFEGRADDPGDPQALQRALSKGSALRRALAARWLAASQDPAHIVALERGLEDDASAGWFPEQAQDQAIASAIASQAFAPSLEWRELTVADAALRGLEQLTGQPFDTEADYRRWRELRPDPAAAPEVWLHALRASPDAEGQLAGLPPDLAARVRWLRGDLPDEELRSLWSTAVGAERTLAVLRGEQRWSEHEDEAVFGRFCRWAVLDLPEAALSSLWEGDALRPGAACKTSLALALARAQPSQRESLLVGVLSEKRAGPIDGVLYELALHHADTQHALLARYLSMPDGAPLIDNGRAAILRAMARGGPLRRAALASLLAESDFQSADARVVSALAEAARATGLVSDGCEGPFELRPLQGEELSVVGMTDLLLQRQRCVTAARRAR